MTRRWTSAKYSVTVGLTAIIVIGLYAYIFPRPGVNLEGGISEKLYLDINGHRHFVSVRGRSLEPILLFVHGGPGDPIGPHIAYYNAELFEHFLVVNYDQRGAGGSYQPTIDPATMTLDTLVKDLQGVVAYLRKRFHQPIILVGHSWGTFLGMHAAQQMSNQICGYVGIGQVADQAASEQLSYDWVQDQAINDASAKHELAKIDRPGHLGYKERLEDLYLQRKWVREYGGAAFDKSNWQVLTMFALPILFYSDYTLAEKMQYLTGETYSMQHLEHELFDQPLQAAKQTFDVPIIVIQGSHDRQTVTELTRAFYKNLRAPYKKYFEIEDAAHLVPMEKPQVFVQTLTRGVLDLLRSRRAEKVPNPCGTEQQLYEDPLS